MLGRVVLFSVAKCLDLVDYYLMRSFNYERSSSYLTLLPFVYKNNY